MQTLLSTSPARRARLPESAPSIAQTKQRWRRAIIDARLPIRRRFELLALLEYAGGFNGHIAIGEAPTWALAEGFLVDRRGSFEFDHLWLLAEEASAEARWLERHGAPMRSTREAADLEAILAARKQADPERYAAWSEEQRKTAEQFAADPARQPGASNIIA